MNKITLTSFYLLVVNLIFAQTSTIITSEQLSNCNEIKSLILNKNELVLIQQKREAMSIQRPNVYNTALSTIDLKETKAQNGLCLSNKKNSNQLSSVNNAVYKVIPINDKQLVVYDNSEYVNPFYLYYQMIDKEGNIDLKGQIEIANMEKFSYFKMALNMVRNPIMYNVNLSKDKKNIFLFYNQVKFGEGDVKVDDRQTILTIDASSMEIKKEINYHLPAFYFVDDFKIDHNNALYSIYKVGGIYRSRDYKNAKWFYKIIGLQADQEKKMIEYDIDLNERAINDAEFEIAENGDLFVSGIYAEVNKKGNADGSHGFFIKRIDQKNNKTVWEIEQQFPPEIIQYTSSKSDAENGKGTSKDFKVVDIKFMKNGSTTVIMEDRHLDLVMYYKALIVANISAEGKVNWVKHIPKNQLSNENNTHKSPTFTSHTSGNTLQIIFTDHKKNYDKISLEHTKKEVDGISKITGCDLRDNSLAMAEIDEKGNIVQKLLISGSNFSFSPQDILWSETGEEIFVVSLKGSESYYISKIKL